MKEELNIVRVLIVIGNFVNFSIVVKVIELSGVVVIIVIILFKIIFIKIGLVFVVFLIIFLIFKSVVFIIGENVLLINFVKGVVIKMFFNKFRLVGVFFLINFIINVMRYFVKNLGSKFSFEYIIFIIRVYIGDMFNVKVINVVVVIFFIFFVVFLILFRNEIFSKFFFIYD